MDCPPFDMFFYGTLMRGQRNHAYCHGALRARNATVRGSLYDLPEGYPALVVLEEDVLAVGTANPIRDASEARFRTRPDGIPALEQPTVSGELYTFDDAGERLRALDRLEGFVPGDPTSPYERVLIPAHAEDGTLTFAWSYVVRHPTGRHLPGGHWPA
ncbi:gamma-glutamylcyclotransferase [Rubrobacter tropicus]|uniref:Gamma-glutamylcyclotransferase n=1 Tax=Rubrobacter tropicus TaxID=2653851 RepID=A0A6G8Q9S7_9ACTN|nr:gamma-glutamylcyclotransferase family protein [Rubrobacter tropicus]QIN83244.1 gamma-glutamylcyclotransferase [Rubrobacter tropicus]